MGSSKKIGIWMDYRTAHIMEFSTRPREVNTLESKLSFAGQKNDEKHSRGTEHQLKAEYFKKIADIILKYDKVLLFGPNYAKIELFNMISDDDRFFNIKFFLKDSGKMTLPERNEFIYEYFASPMFN